jgi:hypothetical protein
MLKLRIGLFTAVLLGLMVGCAREHPTAPAKISGRVVYQNKPVTGGTIMFTSGSQGVYRATLDANGAYEIVDMPTGEMVITVETESLNPKNKAPDYGGGKGAKMYAERMAAERKRGAPIAQQAAAAGQYRKIPEKYGNPKTSPLSMTLEPGRQVKEVVLTD